MKSIILTQAPVTDEEKEILKNTRLFKIAINQHAEELKPDMRIITDYVLGDICRNFSQKVVSVRDKFRYYTGRVEYFDTEFRGATIISAIEYLLSKNYNEILIVGDNTVHAKDFQNFVKREVDKICGNAEIFQYKNGNFNLQVKSISEFCAKE